jgi:hypothetical protein
MGLSEAASELLAGLVAVSSDRFYEGYWDSRFPLADYVAPTPAIAGLLAARDELAAELAALEIEIEIAGRALVAEGRHAYSEYLQAELSSSGPVMFLALRDSKGRPAQASLWSECAMEEASEGKCYCGGRGCEAGCPQGCLDDGQPAAEEPDDDWGDPQMPT